MSKTTERKPISKGVRFEVFKRDKFTCQYCGAQPPTVILHVDHILAVANGGTNDADNLTTACQACNLGKSATPLHVVPQSLADTAQAASEAADQLAAHAAMIREAREEFDAACWEIADTLQPGASDGWSRDKFGGVAGFVKRIGYAATLDAALIASDRFGPGNQRFRYFCGICWNRAREAEQA